MIYSKDFINKVLQLQTINLFDYLDIFPEFILLKDCPQSIRWHGEGSVLHHTNLVMTKALEIAIKETNKELGINLYLAALLHDFGKIDTSVPKEGGKVTAYGHEGAGVWRAREFLKKYFPQYGYARREYILSLVEFHGHPKRLINGESKDNKFRQLSLDVNTRQVHDLEIADFTGRIGEHPDKEMKSLADFKKRCEDLGIWDKYYEVPFSYNLTQTHYNLIRWNILFHNTKEDDPKKRDFLQKLSEKQPRCGLLIPIGAPGSGKTHYINKMYPHLKNVSMDDERKRLCGNASDMSKNQEAYENCFRELKNLMKNRVSAIWDATNTTRKTRRRLIDLARHNGIEVVMIYFDLSLETILKQNKNRDRVVPEDVVIKYYSQLQTPRPYEYDHFLVVNGTHKYETEKSLR